MEGDEERDEMDLMAISNYGWRERRRLEAPGGRLGTERRRGEGTQPDRLRELVERRADGGWVPPPTADPRRESAGEAAERLLTDWEGGGS